MLDDIRRLNSTSNIVTLKLRKASTGLGYTGITYATSGLMIATVCRPGESVSSSYSSSNIEDVTGAVGTYQAPSLSTRCRFCPVDTTNHPGVYDVHLRDERFAIAGAKAIRISVTGVTDLLDAEYVCRLIASDVLDDTVRGGLTALPNAAANAAGGLPISAAGALNLDAKIGAMTYTVANELNTNARYVGGSTVQQTGGYVKAIADGIPQTWYVDGTSGNDSNAGLLRGSAFLTFSQANSVAKFGDTIRVLSGTYSGAKTLSAHGITVVAESGVTFTHNSGATLTISGNYCTIKSLTSTSTHATTGWGIACNLTTGTSILGCTVTGTLDGIYASGSIGLLVDEGTYTTGTYDGINVVNAINVRLRNSKFNTSGAFAGAGQCAAIYMSQTQGVIESCTLSAVKSSTNSNPIAAIRSTHSLPLTGQQGAVSVIHCELRSTASNASHTGGVYGIICEGDDGSQIGVYGGVIRLSNAAATTTRDADASNVASSRVRLFGTDCDRTRFAGDVMLDSSSPDWARVYNPTTTVGLTNTTVGTVTTITEDIQATMPDVLVSTTIATLASQTSFTLTAGSADNDAYNGGFAVFTDQVTSTQKAFNIVSDYTGSTKTVTLLNAPAFAIATGDTVAIFANPNSAILSATNVDRDHTWNFDSPTQITAPNTLSELIGFIGLLAMDFSEPMPARSSIGSISSASFANISGTEPTVTSSSVSLDKKRANILIDATAATANTYTLSVTIVTTDSQTFVRKGRLTIA